MEWSLDLTFMHVVYQDFRLSCGTWVLLIVCDTSSHCRTLSTLSLCPRNASAAHPRPFISLLYAGSLCLLDALIIDQDGWHPQPWIYKSCCFVAPTQLSSNDCSDDDNDDENDDYGEDDNKMMTMTAESPFCQDFLWYAHLPVCWQWPQGNHHYLLRWRKPK